MNSKCSLVAADRRVIESTGSFLAKQWGIEVECFDTHDVRLEQVAASGRMLAVDIRRQFCTPAVVELLTELAERQGEQWTLIVLTDGSIPRRIAAIVDQLAVAEIALPFRESQAAAALSGLDQETARSGARAIPECRELRAGRFSLKTCSESLFPVIDQIERVAAHDFTMLIVGETGSGKSTLARIIHELSPRRDRLFTSVACGALPQELIESELFGHARGSFTGADRNRIGRFEAAGHGTLLLDEIDVLGLREQAKLLHVIETGHYEMVGSTETRTSNARVIVASNVELEELIAEERFRADLYYRLNVLEFRLPSLRQRPMDIVPLAMQFVDELCREHKLQIDAVDTHFLSALKDYAWPGNLRELHNHMRRAVLFCEGTVLTVNDLPLAVIKEPFAGRRPTVPFPVSPTGDETSRTGQSSRAAGAGHSSRIDKPPGHVNLAASQETVVSDSAGDETTLPDATLAEQVAEKERRILLDTLEAVGQNRTAAARLLGISRVGLYKKMRRFGLLNPTPVVSSSQLKPA